MYFLLTFAEMVNIDSIYLLDCKYILDKGKKLFPAFCYGSVIFKNKIIGIIKYIIISGVSVMMLPINLFSRY